MKHTELYVKRCKQLSRLLRAEGEDGIVVFAGHRLSARNYADNPYPFRQDSSVLYYCGDTTENTLLSIDIASGESTLWGDEASMEKIVWTGPRPSLEERAVAAGCGHCAFVDEFSHYVRGVSAGGGTVHYLPQYRTDTLVWLAAMLGISADECSVGVSDALRQAVISQRLTKDEDEVSEIEQALFISYQMYDVAMRLAVPGNSEQDVAGVMAGVVAANGSQHSFPTICSVRGEVLHNHSYSNQLAEGDLLLIDSGAESSLGYASDITRTLPVGGAFSSRQKDVYEIVLQAQQAAISKAAPGVLFSECHYASVVTLTEGLKHLGLLRGDTENLVEQGAFAVFSPHGLGHALGLDVHDMEGLGEDHVGYSLENPRDSRLGFSALRFGKELHAGYCMTVEPGLYMIPALLQQWRKREVCKGAVNYSLAEEYAGFGGVRIEDDICITSSGCKVLGMPIPKTVTEIEDAMGC